MVEKSVEYMTPSKRTTIKRNQYLRKAERLGIKLHKPHNLNLWQIEELVNRHYKKIHSEKEALKPKSKWRYLSYSAIARLAGMEPQLLNYRMRKKGMTLEQALTAKVGVKTHRPKLTDKQMATARKNGISTKIVSSRRNADWSIEDTINLPLGSVRKSKASTFEIKPPQDCRKTRKEKRIQRLKILQAIEKLEDNGGCSKEIEKLEKKMVNL